MTRPLVEPMSKPVTANPPLQVVWVGIAAHLGRFLILWVSEGHATEGSGRAPAS